MTKAAAKTLLTAALLLGAQAGMAMANRHEESQLLRVRWTPPQDEFLRVNVPIALLRIGNQWCGKSFVGAADVIHRCLADHPYDPRGRIGPCRARVISPTDEHSIQIQEKIWELVPKHLLAPGQEFAIGIGFRGRHKVLRFASGSRIEFRTWGGSTTGERAAMANSGGTLDHVLIDELCPRRLYEEMRKRVARRNGTMRLTLTPINAAAAGGSEWLQEKCESGEVKDLHFPLRPEYCIPVGETEPLIDPTSKRPQDSQWCEDFRNNTAEDERGVVVDGEWLIDRADRELAGWSDSYSFTDADRFPRFAEYAVGLDYGEASGRTVALLLAWAPEAGVWVLDEWVGDGKTPAIEAGRSLYRMLARRGLPLAAVRHWVGDVNNAAKVLGYIGSMNEAYSDGVNAAAAEAGSTDRIQIRAAAKGRGSVEFRIRMLNEALSMRRLRIYTGCNRLLTSLRTYRKGARNAAVLKDPLDALGYAAEIWLRTTNQPQAYAIHRR